MAAAAGAPPPGQGEAADGDEVAVRAPHGGFGRTEQASTSTCRDAASGTAGRVHHARLTSLVPDTDYVYAAVHDGTTPEPGTLRTADGGGCPLKRS
ncbi:fibronectin type III domain-containing protein [Kitasatospora sp. NPDC127111]|uniref:fibronectin type III domain-containing protein n=1 Tax=Kitasatospora sp. NPDC127111 TaxID=3345363 RepID=UPI00363A5780